MMNNTKMTNTKALEMAIKALSENESMNEVVEKLEKMLETTKKKSVTIVIDNTNLCAQVCGKNKKNKINA